VTVGYDRTKHEFYIDRTSSGKTDFSRKFSARHTAPTKPKGTENSRLIDNSSVEYSWTRE